MKSVAFAVWLPEKEIWRKVEFGGKKNYAHLYDWHIFYFNPKIYMIMYESKGNYCRIKKKKKHLLLIVSNRKIKMYV